VETKIRIGLCPSAAGAYPQAQVHIIEQST
jgi:hypothetical protein